MHLGKISVGCGIGLWEIERGVIHWECGMGCSSLHYISLLSELGNIARNPNINNRGHLVIVKLVKFFNKMDCRENLILKGQGGCKREKHLEVLFSVQPVLGSHKMAEVGHCDLCPALYWPEIWKEHVIVYVYICMYMTMYIYVYI